MEDKKQMVKPEAVELHALWCVTNPAGAVAVLGPEIAAAVASSFAVCNVAAVGGMLGAFSIVT